MPPTYHAPTETIDLHGTTYDLVWATPTDPSVDAWADATVRSDGPYGDHVNPLYNLQEDVPADLPTDDDWPGFWQQLARSLAGKLSAFALVAYERGRIAGHMRTFPKTLTRPRFGAWSCEEHRAEWRDDILWLGAACVDLEGAEDGLDGVLLDRVVSRAKATGFTKIQALAWSEARIYALWGQALPLSVYTRLGFHPVTDVREDLLAFPDMLAGRHGETVQALANADVKEGTITHETADHRSIVELPLT